MNYKGLLAFTAGLVIGSAGSYFYTKNKYEKLIDEEVASVKESFSKLQKDRSEINKNKPDITAYTEALEAARQKSMEEKESVADYSMIHTPYDEDEGPFEEPDDNDSEFDIIGMDEFTRLNNYDKVDVTLFTDGIFADDEFNEIDMDSMCGIGATAFINQSDASELYLRNDARGIDFGIAKDNRTFEEAVAGY